MAGHDLRDSWALADGLGQFLPMFAMFADSRLLLDVSPSPKLQ